MLWKVCCGKVWIGIVVSNYDWEKPYWEYRSLVTGENYRLVPLTEKEYVHGVTDR